MKWRLKKFASTEKGQTTIIAVIIGLLFIGTYTIPERLHSTISAIGMVVVLFGLLLFTFNYLERVRKETLKNTLESIVCLTCLFSYHRPKDWKFAKAYKGGLYWDKLQLRNRDSQVLGIATLWVWYVLDCDNKLQLYYLNMALRRYEGSNITK